jgi:lysophospholipase L1-like esterase
MRERTAYLIALGTFSLFMIIFDRIGARGVAKRSSARSVAQAMSTSQTKKPLRVFCYGDSLTAGTSPPSFQEFPYALHLERILQQLDSSISVQHRGLPGWTSNDLLRSDAREAIKAASPMKVAIILAGTNDLGQTPDPRPIIENVIALHRLFSAAGVPQTVAIGVPSSGYQSAVPEAAQKAQTVNDALAQFCESEPGATYVPFPFGFSQGDDKWSPDGLHFSPKGYQILGESLAPVVQKLLMQK